ncbi:hypothetical protein B0H14DRAFT_3729457 [Mycena olivaceomarginata]|nr:hypothetical protein B0H14DRAFT_3729457 [Mycena olivaceomarginata]
MAPSPLEALKQGYEKLKKQVGHRKKALLVEDRLANKERIPDDDGEWLDNEANLVDEQRVLEDLEAASDYERGVSRLDTKRKAAWARMKELAGGVKPSVAVSMPTTKRKRPEEKAVVLEGKQPGKKKGCLTRVHEGERDALAAHRDLGLPRPTRREALSTAQTLRKYTETLDDGFACKLEQLLASFGHQTQLEETNALPAMWGMLDTSLLPAGGTQIGTDFLETVNPHDTTAPGYASFQTPGA